MITVILNGVQLLITWKKQYKKGSESNLYGGKINIDIANRIREIRNNENLSYSKIAKMFNVSKATIINICKNRIYV